MGGPLEGRSLRDARRLSWGLLETSPGSTGGIVTSHGPWVQAMCRRADTPALMSDA